MSLSSSYSLPGWNNSFLPHKNKTKIQMGFSRFFLFLYFSWNFLIWRSNQLQPSQTQVLLQLRKQLEYSKLLDSWINPGIDLCYMSSPQVNITCQDNSVSEIRIVGDWQTRPSSFNGFPIPSLSLSQNFSMDSLVATLSRLNSLRILSLVSLGMWGPIPDKIHRLQNLECLDMSWNFLYGSIPQTVSRILKLQILKIDGNFLNGSFPDFLGSFTNLTSLSLRNNRFNGPLPASISKISSLTDINLSNNGISGKLPDLSSLSGLRWIDLSSNELASELPRIPKGIIVILLNNNSLSGRIPDQYGQLNQLQQLDLSFNALQGTVPSGIFALPNIISLKLSSNSLTGLFPMHFTCGRNLGLVDISNNRLRGPLPSCLKKTRVVNIGGNCLLIDARNQHPETYCAEEMRAETKSHEKKNVWVLVGVLVGIAIVLGVLAFGFVVLCRHYCPKGTSEQHLLQNPVQENSVSGFTSQILSNARYITDNAKLGSQGVQAHRLFSFDELKEATNNFDNHTLIGEGSNGKMYKGRLENGAQVAIRCLTVSRKYTIRNLKLRLDLLAKLRHPNLVCFLGHCIESEETDESDANKVYLVYEFVPNGNYRAHLSETNMEKVLKWPDRLAILIGIAKSVHFLHTGIIPGFVSNRLKSNNILLNEHRLGKLSDYGLSIVAQELDKEDAGRKSWQTKSMEDDIYSFGFILLESLIGPSFLARKESFLLNEMVSLGNPDGQKWIIDPIVLSSCSQDSLSIVISLAINCISPESSTRPSFEDVLWNLQYAAQVQAASDGDHRIGKTILSP